MTDDIKFELVEDLEQVLSEVLQEQESGKNEDRNEELIRTVMEATLDDGNPPGETAEAALPQPQEQSPDQPVKRRRGRPRKSEVAASQSKSSSIAKDSVPKMRLSKSIKVLAYKIWTGAIFANTPIKSLKNKELQAIKYLHSKGYLRIEEGKLALSKEFLAVLLGIKIKDEHTIGSTIGALLAE